MSMNKSSITNAKMTPFDELRFGYFDIAFGNMLKAIRGGTNPIGVMTLAMCCVSALSEIEWSLNNQIELETTGELKASVFKQRKALGYIDKVMFEDWLNRWIVETGINPDCDAAKVYGVRCGLVHTAGASEALAKTGVKGWKITTREPVNHYKVMQEDVARFRLEMPDFLAELMLASDKFLYDRKTDLNNASRELQFRLAFIAVLSSADPSGYITGRLIRNVGSLAWFDKKLSASPLQIHKNELAEKIRQAYEIAIELVMQ